MRVGILRNKSEIKYLDKCSNQFVYDNFGEDSECIWGLWDDDRNIIGYCTLGFAEGVISFANYTDLLLSDVYILSKYRKKGYGTYFLNTVLNEVYAPVYAEILFDNLLHFYTCLGFIEIEPGLLLRE